MKLIGKKSLLSIGALAIISSPIMFTLSCGEDSKPAANIEMDITGTDVLKIDLSTATATDAQAIVTKQAQFDAIPGKHYALVISTPTATTKMVYAYKTVAQGFDSTITTSNPRGNSLEISATGYKGYNHKIEGVAWVHDMSFYTYYNNMKGLIDGSYEYGYTDIKGADVLTADLATMTEAQAKAMVDQINLWKLSPGKHFAVVITTAETPGETARIAKMVYAVKSNAEGYMDDVEGDKLVDINDDNTGYVGYKHKINGVKWTLSYHYYAIYNLLLAKAGEDTIATPPVEDEPNDPTAPIVIKELTQEDIIDITLPTSGNVTTEEKVALEEAIYKHNGLYATNGTVNAGKHWAVRITKGNVVGTMVYAYKTIEEGWVSNSGQNLLGFDGTQYAGYDHKIDGVSWHHGFTYYDLWNDVKRLAATNIGPADILSGNLSEMTKQEAIDMIAERNRRLTTSGDIFAISLRQAPTSARSTLVFVVKKDTDTGWTANPTTETEYTGNADRATKKYLRLQFEDGGQWTDWKHDSTFYGLWQQVVAKANTP